MKGQPLIIFQPGRVYAKFRIASVEQSISAAYYQIASLAGLEIF